MWWTQYSKSVISLWWQKISNIPTCCGCQWFPPFLFHSSIVTQICKDFSTCATSLSWLHLKHTVSPCADLGTNKRRMLPLMREAFHMQPNGNAWGHMKCMKRSLLQRSLQYVFWSGKLYMVVIFYWLKSYFCISCM